MARAILSKTVGSTYMDDCGDITNLTIYKVLCNSWGICLNTSLSERTRARSEKVGFLYVEEL